MTTFLTTLATNDNLTMSSREIAELTGKDHKNVLTDIRKMLEDLDLHSAEFSAQYKDATGRALPVFNLPKRESIILVSGYNIKMRAAIIDRWQELESQAAKKVKKLEAELDRSNEYATIKKMENVFNQKFSWRKLKATSEDLDIDVQQIPDKNYGSVNSYHRLVWLEDYGLDINTSKAEAQKMILLEKLNALFAE